MKRSVILMGGKTYVLSLPSQWIKKYNIQKGEELDLEEKDNSIIVRTEHSPSAREITLDFSPLDLMLGRALGAVYKSGYSRARITFETKEQLQKIEETLQRTLVGFEIVKQDKNYLIIESLAEIQAQEFDASLKRLFYSLETMGEDLFVSLTTNNKEGLEKVIQKDGHINRLADFCRRVINSGQVQFLKKSSLLYYLVEQLEKIGDVYKEIAKEFLVHSFLFSEQLQLVYKKIQLFFIHYRELFYKFSLDQFESFGREFLSLRDQIHTLKEKNSPRFLFQIEHLLEMIIDMNGVLLTYHL